MTTKKGGGTASPPRRRLLVRNRHHSLVILSFAGETPPGRRERPRDIVLHPGENAVLEADLWEEDENLARLKGAGLVEVEPLTGPAPPPVRRDFPRLAALKNPIDRGVARDIVYGSRAMAMSIIHMDIHTDESSTAVDVEAMHSRHKPILLAALEALELLGVHPDRQEAIRKRLAEIDALR